MSRKNQYRLTPSNIRVRSLSRDEHMSTVYDKVAERLLKEGEKKKCEQQKH